MRAVHVVPAVSSEASGPSYSVVRLCESLLQTGCVVTLAALDLAPMAGPPAFLKTFRLGSGPRRLGRSPHLRRWLANEAGSGRADLIHNHSLWMMPNVYSSWAAKGARVPLVVSPRGTLSRWAFQSGSAVKRLFWPLLQRPALEAAACFHATAESELEDIRRHGFRQPVAVIPNGIDIPDLPHDQTSHDRMMLFLGRLHPKKGLDLLLPAWQRVEDRFPDWRLVIAGPDAAGYRAKMESLAGELGLVRVEFAGPLYGEQKWRAYRAADLFVLATHSDNFAVTVAEALAAGTPAVVSKGAPWVGLERHGAGWWVDIGVEPLAAALESALASPRELLAEMGRRGRAWVAAEFSWATIGRQMAGTYEWLLRGGERPPWIQP